MVREGDAEAVAAALALRDEEAVLEVAAGDEGLDFIADERRQRARAFFEAVSKRRPMLAHEGEGVAVLSAARDVLRSGMTAGHGQPRCASRSGHSPESFRALG